MAEFARYFDTDFFKIVGGISTLVMIIGFLVTVYYILKGVVPVWIRLGLGLSRRKIAIFAEDGYSSLKDMFEDSRIFASVVQIHENDIRKAEKDAIFVVHWKDFADKLDEILISKGDWTPLIIYAPQKEGVIGEMEMEKINSHRNAVVVNFRGRLLNDVLTSLITTSYDR